MTRRRGGATWADTDPRGRLPGVQAKDKHTKLIGPRVWWAHKIERGGRTKPSG